MADPFKVIILGGGIGGLSAAHELAERNGQGADFEVHVYEKLANTVGGKARSIGVPQSMDSARPDLPGEHGFRFFPGFYRHLPDTMARIPDPNGTNVFKNLVVADELMLARIDQKPIVMMARVPQTVDEWLLNVQALLLDQLSLTPLEASFFLKKLLKILTSCRDRRLKEFERQNWWDFVEADRFSKDYQDLLASGLTRSLLANDPKLASLFTAGNTNIQLLQGLVDPAHPVDRLLNGPTTAVWLEPWWQHLKGQGVQFHMGHIANRITMADGRIASVAVDGPDGPQVVTGDAYIFALPVERMADLLVASEAPGGPLEVAPELANIVTLKDNVRWMNGIQYFLREDVPMCHGHALYSDSPWALTSVSQAQFWPGTKLAEHGDGQVRGIISVCISDWDKPGLNGLTAKQCTRDQIKAEVWEQLKRAANGGGEQLLDDDNVHSVFLDPAISDFGGGVQQTNEEPLFVNLINTWKIRPEAWTDVPNMFLASDYIRTRTDIASMEAANEAARLCVNRILGQAHSAAAPCQIWPLNEPDFFEQFQALDQIRFDLEQALGG